jgi:hypothetical protein
VKLALARETACLLLKQSDATRYIDRALAVLLLGGTLLQTLLADGLPGLMRESKVRLDGL